MHCGKITNKIVNKIRKIPNVRSITIHFTMPCYPFSKNLQDKHVEVLRNHPTLREVNFGHCNITDKTAYILSTCLCLRKVVFIETGTVTDESIKALIACPKLKVLVLDGIFLTDESAKYLLEYPSLTTVHFNYCWGLTDETPKILSQASNIKVKFHMCKYISKNAIDEYHKTGRK